MYIFLDKTFHQILLEIVQNERLLHRFIAQVPYLTKSFFLGDCPKCFSPIRLHYSSKCIISRKSSVNDLCVHFSQTLWDLWKLQIDYALLVWYGLTYQTCSKCSKKVNDQYFKKRLNYCLEVCVYRKVFIKTAN